MNIAVQRIKKSIQFANPIIRICQRPVVRLSYPHWIVLKKIKVKWNNINRSEHKSDADTTYNCEIIRKCFFGRERIAEIYSTRQTWNHQANQYYAEQSQISNLRMSATNQEVG